MDIFSAFFKKPQVIIVAGIEGSGKTTFCKKLVKEQGYAYISADEEHNLFVSDYSNFARAFQNYNNSQIPESVQEKNDIIQTQILNDILNKIVAFIRNGRKIVFDGTNSNKPTRELIIKVLRRYGVVRIVCYWMDTPLKVCLKRKKKNKECPKHRVISSKTIKRTAERFEIPTVDEGFDHVFKLPLSKK